MAHHSNTWLLLCIFTTICYCRTNPLDQRHHSSARFKRIRNGMQPKPYSQQWMARLHHIGRNTEGICGAFLISRPPNHMSPVEHGSSDVVLTAAHCVRAFHVKNLYVTFGRQNISNDGEHNMVKVFVDRSIIHENYFYPQYRGGLKAQNDIAMLKLKKPVTFNEYIKPLALANSSSLVNCSASGWGDFHLSNGALTTMPLNNIHDFGYYLEAAMLNDTRIVSGDSGSPIVCMDNSQYVSRGIVSHGMREYPINGSEYFNDVFDKLPWIMKAFTIIDSRELYHKDLALYSNRLSTRSSSFVEAPFYIRDRPNFDKNLDHSYRTIFEYVDVWFQGFVYSKISTQKERFCSQNMFGYVNVDNVYHCAAFCYQNFWSMEQADPSTVCSFFPKMKRCYLAHYYPQCPTIPVEGSITISFWSTGLTSTRETPTLLNDGVEPMVKLIRQSWDAWNVSLTVVGDTNDQYCLGYVTSYDFPLYQDAIFSSTCITHIIRNSNISVPDLKVGVRLGGKLFEHVVGAYNISEQLDVESHKTVELSIFVPIDSWYPLVYGHYQLNDSPVLKTYRPYSGAFSSPPNLQPWIVRFNMENNDTCMGVLIDSKVLIDFTKGNETKFALTTATCAKRMYLQSVNLISNSYYLGQKEHKVAVVSTYLHPQYSKGKKLAHGRREARAVYDVAIVRLATPIVFQANVQPIQLPIKPVSFESTFFIVTWNVSGSDARGPLYDVPVEINGTANFKLMMKKNQKKITTKRLFYCGNKMLDNELDGRPLVAYDRHSEDVVLAGFYSKGHENGVETHVAIHQHLPWIKETLISSELRFRKL